jgi:PAS domain S-box-containing protein
MLNPHSYTRIKILPAIFTGLWIFLSSPLALSEPRELVVGSWDNQPLVFRDAEGKITGLAIDILEKIASQNDWKLTYKHASWAENFEALQNGQIDLLPVIAYSQKRDEIFDYPKETLINNWGVVYQTTDNNFTSIKDLNGKRVALVTKVIHSKVFTDLMDQFNFDFEVIPAKDFEEVLTILDEGKADAGVINRIISIMQADTHQVKPTTIIFNPVQVRYAVPQGKNQDIVDAIDTYLVDTKSDSKSFYYQSVNKWLKNEGTKANYSWVFPLVSIALILMLLVAGYILLVKREVKRRTAALTESENRFRQMADNINSVFWIVSADWNELIYVSPGYEKIWKKPVDSLYKNTKSWLDIIHPDDLEQVKQDIANKTSPNTSAPAFKEYRIVRPDGQERWISTHAYPVYDKDGKLYRYAGISDDITSNKLAELALTVSKIEIETVLNSISDVVVYGNLNREIILINPAMEKTFGYTSEDLIGKQTSILYADMKDFEKQGKRQFGLKSNINYATFEVSYRRKDGSTFIGETFGTKVFDAEGNPIGFIGVIRDVTQRKQVESELLDYKNHLEELVSERTIELSNLNKELEAFSYSVSHDLRAPLRAINGFSTMLYEDNASQLDEESENYLKRIVKASVKMERLIDDLLQISRVTRADLQKEEINLSKLASDILKGLQNEDPERPIKWQVENGLIINGDKTLISVLMQNLIGNAWKYTARCPESMIKFYRHNANGSDAAFCVEDNGIGFDTKYSEKIFLPFQRLHSDNEFEGTGIGLATVNRVVHRHGGKIWVESELNKGSRFYFNL